MLTTKMRDQIREHPIPRGEQAMQSTREQA